MNSLRGQRQLTGDGAAGGAGRALLLDQGPIFLPGCGVVFISSCTDVSILPRPQPAGLFFGVTYATVAPFTFLYIRTFFAIGRFRFGRAHAYSAACYASIGAWPALLTASKLWNSVERPGSLCARLRRSRVGDILSELKRRRAVERDAVSTNLERSKLPASCGVNYNLLWRLPGSPATGWPWR
jgi:hypothetical protein